MKINIVLSTYNGAKFLAEQIESIQKTDLYRLAAVDPR